MIMKGGDLSMKTMKNNNKGVALVTVLIGVSFIIILAASLVYMSYMNYITKALRFASTDNFYTDEFALDDLCMSLQQEVYGSATVDAAKTALRTACGATTNAGITTYNNESVASLIQVASQEATVSVNTIIDTSTQSNYIESGSSVKLLGVAVTTITEQGYQSTISTDITIAFPNGVPGELDVNDFSVITDSPLAVAANDLFLGGCVFLSNGGDPSVLALDIKQNANVQILATRGIINGDIKVDGNSLLAITGNVTVLGTITLTGNSTLICSDKLQVTGGVSMPGAGNTSRIIGSGPTVPVDYELPDNAALRDALEHGLANMLFADIYVTRKATSDGGGVDFYPVSIFDLPNIAPSNHRTFTVDGTSKDITAAIIGGSLDNLNSQSNQYDDTLILSPRTNSFQVYGAFINSTIVSAGPIVFGNPGNYNASYMTSMSDESYEAAKALMFNAQGGGSWRSGGTDIGEIKFANDGAYMFPDDFDSYTQADDVIFDDPDTTIDRRYIARQNGYGGEWINHVPYGYLLREDSSSYITEIFGALQGEADASNCTLYVENWNKE